MVVLYPGLALPLHEVLVFTCMYLCCHILLLYLPRLNLLHFVVLERWLNLCCTSGQKLLTLRW